MEEIFPEKHKILNIKSKSQLYFGSFSEKISQLKIFIYGLKEVNKYQFIFQS